MARNGYTVVDTHHHTGSLEALGFRIWDEDLGPREMADLEFETRLQTMDATGVDQAVILPGHGYLRPDGLADTRATNDHLAAYRDRRPDRFPAAVGVVEPIYGERGLAEVDRVADQLGLVGITFHTRFQGVSTNSPLVMALVQRMAEKGLVPFIHAIAEVPDEAMWRVGEVAGAIPDTTVVVLDAFSSSEQGEHALRVADAHPNLVLDTSLSHGLFGIDRFVSRFGYERMVFGTDIYSHAKPHAHNHTLDSVLESGWPAEVLEAVLAGNIRRILGLPATP